MSRDYPYTSDDLRYLADRIDEVTIGIGSGHDDLPVGDWRWGLTVDIYDDGGDVAGQMRPYGDGWIGFYPKSLTQQDNRLFGGD